MWAHLIRRFGAVVAAGGVIWAVHLATQEATTWNEVIENLRFDNLPSGPLELSAVGILVWMLGKWRSTVRLR